MTHTTICAHLKELHLPTIRACFKDQAEVARAQSLSYEEYLLELLEREIEERRNSRIQRRLRESRLPLEKNFATLELSRLPDTVRHQVAVLKEGAFLDRTENILAFGNPGSGKSHLLSALGF